MKTLSEIFSYIKLQSRKKQSNFACKAPFNTLFFSMTGEVYFCLKNKEQLLGKYPQNSVKEIIEGQNTTKLRTTFLKENGLPGCEFCREQINLGNLDSAFNHYSNVKGKKGAIAVIEFELSNQCNLGCIMCSELYSSKLEANGIQTRTPYDDQFIIQISPYLKNLIKASFRGGEPFLVSIYYKIWDYLIQTNSNVKIFVTTNGTVFSPKINRYLLTKQFHISLSIDTLSEDTFSEIRINGNYNNFRKNINHFVHLASNGIISLSVCTCLMTLNWTELPSIFDFCHKNNIPIHINYVETPENLSLRQLTINELKQIIDFFKKNLKQNDYNINSYNEIICTLNDWVINHNKLPLGSTYAKLMKLIEEKSIPKHQLDNQKKIFLDNLSIHTSSKIFENITSILENFELKYNPKEDIVYLYLFFNQLSITFVVESICKNMNDTIFDLIHDIIKISKRKFTIHE